MGSVISKTFMLLMEVKHEDLQAWIFNGIVILIIIAVFFLILKIKELRE